MSAALLKERSKAEKVGIPAACGGEDVNMFDIICLGDTTQDIILTLNEAHLHRRLHPNKPEICFPFGSKILVDEITYSLGGNAANTAVGLVRLGIKTGLNTLIGDDERGRWIIHCLKKEKVKLNMVKTVKGQDSNQSVIINYQKERTIFSYHAPKKARYRPLIQTKWVYLTSAGGDGNHLRQLLKPLISQKIPLVYNPGTYELKQGLHYLKPILKNTTLLILNQQEANQLLGKQRIEKHLQQLTALGARRIVITLGQQGSFGFDGQKKYFVAAKKGVKIIDKTGAGDSYTAGLISALIKGRTIFEGMKWGTVNAASVISHPGHLRGLLNEKEIKKEAQRLS